MFYEQIRAKQASQLLDWVQKTAQGRPCVIAVDMNAAPTRGQGHDYPPEAYSTAIGHPLGLRSAYADVLGKEPAYTSWKIRSAQGKSVEVKYTVDYIFITNCIATDAVLAAPADGCVEPRRLPSFSYPSDHIALMAKLRFGGIKTEQAN
uniref:Nocturnin n=1 Tax=Octactis speculum TaxID=3111310 RepID=A0A7S2DPB0_9STRA